MDLTKAIQNRHSVKKFNSKKPDWRDIIEAIDATRYAPTAGKNFILKFILVNNKELIEKISIACEQDFIAKVHYLVVVCSNPSRLINAYGKYGEKYAEQQAGAAIQNFLLKIEELGLATCWVGYFIESKIKKILKIPNEITIEAVLPIGYEFEKKYEKKVRIELDNILYFNEWEKKNYRT
ncbi:MAG: nitroreductase family protein [Candidatus Pacearchaeota archaeon]